MSNIKQSKNELARPKSDGLESAIEAIKQVVNVTDMVILVGVRSPEVAGTVEEDGELWHEVIPLGEGIHVVLSIDGLVSHLPTGIHEVTV